MVKKVLSSSFLALVLLFLYTPVLFVVAFSFTKSQTIGSWQGFSFALYKDLFVGHNSSAILLAFRNTMVIGILSSLIATILGTLGAIGIFNMKKKTRTLLTTVNQIPILNSDIVTAVALLLFFVVIGLDRGFLTVLLAHISFSTPYVVLSVLPKLKQMNKNTYEAAIDLGATPFLALFKVIIPEILPGMINGFLLAFTLSIDDFVVTNFTTSSGFDTLSTFIYKDAVKGGLTPSLRALSSLIFVFILAMLLIMNLRTNKKINKEKTKK